MKEAIAGLCNVDQEAFQLVIDELPCRNTGAVKEAFIPNSSHRIRRKLQDCGSLADGLPSTLSEYHAGGEWELLLSETLLGAYTDIDSSQSKDGKSMSQNESSDSSSSDSSLSTTCIHKESFLEEAARWSRVLHATVSAMITATALLRLSLSGGKGRKQHNLAAINPNNEKGKEREESPLRHHTHGDYPLVNLSQSQLKLSVSKALSFLSDAEPCGYLNKITRKCARATVCHLVESDSDLNNLAEMNIIRNALAGLTGLSNATKEHKSNEVKPCSIVLIEKLIDSINRKSSPVEEGAGGILKEKCMTGNELKMRLLSCLGLPYCKISVNTVAELFHDTRILLSPEFVNHDSPSGWRWNDIQEEAIELLVTISHGRTSKELNVGGRSKTVAMVKDLLTVEEHCIQRFTGSIANEKNIKILCRAMVEVINARLNSRFGEE